MIETEIFFIKKSNKSSTDITISLFVFIAFLNKKESVPTGCSKKRCHVVARLDRIAYTLLRLAPSGQQFLLCNSTIKTIANSV